ncbi:MAG: multicopper oxidase domain-containing protein [Nitrospirae bacterium]|nr:multicopper oxidase domain-containing protein [Nitrospirota bacterium]
MDFSKTKRIVLAAFLTCLIVGGAQSLSMAQDIHLKAKKGFITEPDGNGVPMWGFTQDGNFRYPGPTIEVNQNEVVNVYLQNIDVPEPVSIVFFGQEGVSNQDPVYVTNDGLTTTLPGDKRTLRSMAAEALPGGAEILYTFTASKAGTYYYQSGTHADEQIDMGLFGGIIVRPTGYNAATNKIAYANCSNCGYDREFLFLLSAVDSIQHNRVEAGLPYESTSYMPSYWFINGRSFPDTLEETYPESAQFQSQPMNALVKSYPGEKLLFRTITLDRDIHPFHHHGVHALVLAKNGKLLQSASSAPLADLAVLQFSQSVPVGETADSIWSWDANDPSAPQMGGSHETMLGYDIYGNDQNNLIPVAIPQDLALVHGPFYSGSPYLGKTGDLPVAETAVSLNHGGEHYMIFHSHHEIELTNFDETPGGMMTQIMICAPGAQACQ